jgi:predicted TIM-barrel enzyme
MHADEDKNNQMVHDIKAMNPDIPVILGGKTNLDNVASRLKVADGALVGSCFEGGNWGREIDENIVREYVDIVRSLEK